MTKLSSLHLSSQQLLLVRNICMHYSLLCTLHLFQSFLLSLYAIVYLHTTESRDFLSRRRTIRICRQLWLDRQPKIIHTRQTRNYDWTTARCICASKIWSRLRIRPLQIQRAKMIKEIIVVNCAQRCYDSGVENQRSKESHDLQNNPGKDLFVKVSYPNEVGDIKIEKRRRKLINSIIDLWFVFYLCNRS